MQRDYVNVFCVSGRFSEKVDMKFRYKNYFSPIYRDFFFGQEHYYTAHFQKILKLENGKKLPNFGKMK